MLYIIKVNVFFSYLQIINMTMSQNADITPDFIPGWEIRNLKEPTL